MKPGKNLSSFLDLARWLAAFFVVINHLRSIVFVDYQSLDAKNLILQFIYFITGFGHQAVIIFFVLSGFLVGGSVIEKIRTNRFSIKAYLIDRISRLYSVLPFALASGFFLDKLGILFFNSSGLYTHKVDLVSLNYEVFQRLDLKTFLSNLFMLQNILTNTLGSNEPLWSLANEFWYYLLFPLIILLGTSQNSPAKEKLFLLAIMLVALMSLSTKMGNMLLYFSIWLLGVLLWSLKEAIFKDSRIPSFLLVAVLVLIRTNLLNFVNLFTQDFLLAATFGLLINSIMWSEGRSQLRFQRLNQWMSSFSYSLYLLHWPLAVFCISLIKQKLNIGLQMQPNQLSFLIFAALIIVVYFYSYVIARFTEYKTAYIKVTLKQIIL